MTLHLIIIAVLIFSTPYIEGYNEVFGNNDVILLSDSEVSTIQRLKRDSGIEVADIPADDIGSGMTVDDDEVNPKFYEESVLVNSNEDSFKEHWVDIEAVLEKNETLNVIGSSANSELSNSYRRSAIYRLENFQFPFYGQKFKELMITSGGFLSLSPTRPPHRWLAATQYIAPLMANFDTSKSENSKILHVETDDYLAVEWREVVLRGQETDGNFTFMVKLAKNGTIDFLYKNIPIDVSQVSDEKHSRKVGISDAYQKDETSTLGIGGVTKRIIFEYHRIAIDYSKIQNFTIVRLFAKPVCTQLETCSECLKTDIPDFNCSWCPGASDMGSFCADNDGLLRRRSDWLLQGCDKQQDATAADLCDVPALNTTLNV